MSDKHIVSAFDRDLEDIQSAMLTMGELVQAALTDAAQALKTSDSAMAEKIRKGDRLIDGLDQTVKTETAKLLALRSPTAGDLRTVLSVMEISSHLERCGDYAKNISKRTIAMAESDEIEGSLSALVRMTAFVVEMITDALDAYVKRDLTKAKEIIERDVEADQIYNTLFRSLLTHMMEDPRKIAVGMHLHFIAKNIERVGDHATGIAEQSIYLITGEMPDDERPKLDSSSLGLVESDD
ncbi:phosphate signaling complex protein PhoU [Roseovarius aestuarii]|nr:phosphate signaling complex protein PhoU [Roseovarius aestuarii]